MDKDMIVGWIRTWLNIRTDATEVENTLSEGNYFSFTVPSYLDKEKPVHVYPAIKDGLLTFVVIPEEFDVASYSASIQDYVTVCPINSGLSSTRIPNAVAAERINRWINDYQKWSLNQVTNTPYGIFEVFVISGEDFEVLDTEVYLGLRAEDPAASTDFVADLIVSNHETSNIVYDDFADAIPPVPPAAAATEFYLLESALAPL